MANWQDSVVYAKRDSHKWKGLSARVPADIPGSGFRTHACDLYMSVTSQLVKNRIGHGSRRRTMSSSEYKPTYICRYMRKATCR